MKKITIFLYVLILFCISSVTTYSASINNSDSGNTYNIDEYGVSITIPSEYIVITRDIPDDDPNLSEIGLSKSEMLSLMISGNSYLDALDKNTNSEIVVTIRESPVPDFNLCDDAMLEDLMSTLLPGFDEAGVNLGNIEVYQNQQAKYIKIQVDHQLNGSDKTYAIEYLTSCNDILLCLTLSSYSGKIDPSTEKVLNTIVDSIKFEELPVDSADYADKQASVYKDEEAGCEFTMPGGWSRDDFLTEAKLLDVKFKSDKNDSMTILYGSEDIWGNLPSRIKKDSFREDYDNSMLTSDDVADMLGASGSELSKVYYNGYEYYKYVYDYSASKNGIEVSVKMTSILRIENGYMYMFQFSGDSSSPYYSDFESVLESAEYSEETNAKLEGKGSSEEESDTELDSSPSDKKKGSKNKKNSKKSKSKDRKTSDDEESADISEHSGSGILNRKGLTVGISALAGIALWALLPGFIAKKKGRSFWGYYFLSFIITPLISLIVTLCLRDISKEA